MRNDNTQRCPHDYPVIVRAAPSSHGEGWVSEFAGPDCFACRKDTPLRTYKPGASAAATEARGSGPAESELENRAHTRVAIREAEAGVQGLMKRVTELEGDLLKAQRMVKLLEHQRTTGLSDLRDWQEETGARIAALESNTAGHPHLVPSRSDADPAEEEKARQWMDAAIATRKPVIDYLSVSTRAFELADRRTTYTFVSNATRCVFCKATILKHEAELAMPFGWRHASCRVEVRNRRRVVIETGYKDAPGRGMCARLALLDSLNRGEAPIASHLLYPIVLGEDHPPHRRTGIEAGLSWLSVADAVVVYTDAGITDGVAFAIALAEAFGVPVEYRKLEESGVQDPT